MSIPDVDSSGNLPPGIHPATWEEIVDRFASTAHRQGLLGGLRRALESLRDAGCSRVYLDGSFVTSKEDPEDFDGCWEAEGVDPAILDSTLLDFTNRRTAQKAKFGGELFVAEASADRFGHRFLEFFQRDKGTGDPKGILAIDLRNLT
jgi:hypothetical protein